MASGWAAERSHINRRLDSQHEWLVKLDERTISQGQQIVWIKAVGATVAALISSALGLLFG